MKTKKIEENSGMSEENGMRYPSLKEISLHIQRKKIQHWTIRAEEEQN